MADVAFASRSIAVADLRSALRKLSSIARRRCCITMTTGTSPRVDARVLAELGVDAELNRDYIYAFGMLAQAGFEPEVRYIHSSRKDSFESEGDAFGDFSQMIDIGAPALSEAERLQAQPTFANGSRSTSSTTPKLACPIKRVIHRGLSRSIISASSHGRSSHGTRKTANCSRASRNIVSAKAPASHKEGTAHDENDFFGGGARARALARDAARGGNR